MTHLAQLFQPHAVFPGDATAHLYGQLEDRRTKLLGPAHLLRFARVEQNQRVQVAVAGVKHIGHRQSVMFRQP